MNPGQGPPAVAGAPAFRTGAAGVTGMNLTSAAFRRGWGTGVTAALLPSLAAWLIENFGWRRAFLGVSLLPIAVALPLVLSLFREPGCTRPGLPMAARVAGVIGASIVAGRLLAGLLIDRCCAPLVSLGYWRCPPRPASCGRSPGCPRTPPRAAARTASARRSLRASQRFDRRRRRRRRPIRPPRSRAAASESLRGASAPAHR